MVEWLQAPAAKLGDLNLIPETHMIEEGNHLLKNCPLTPACARARARESTRLRVKHNKQASCVSDLQNKCN